MSGKEFAGWAVVLLCAALVTFAIVLAAVTA
jgi:hypothetical protein